MTAYGERIARVEVEIQELRKAFDEHKEATTQQFADLNRKMDSLLELRNKGAGVFWLASVLFGTSIIGVVGSLIAWWRG